MCPDTRRDTRRFETDKLIRIDRSFSYNLTIRQPEKNAYYTSLLGLTPSMTTNEASSHPHIHLAGF